MVTQNGYNFLVQISNKEGRNYRMSRNGKNMIELKRNQIIQTRNGRNYIIKNILPREGGVIAKDENKYEFFIRFRDC